MPKKSKKYPARKAKPKYSPVDARQATEVDESIYAQNLKITKAKHGEGFHKKNSKTDLDT